MVKRLATKHPPHKADIPPMPGTPISELLDSEWLISREVRIRFKTSRLAAIVRKLRKEGVRIDDLWRYSDSGNPFKEHRNCIDDREREITLGRRSADAQAEKESADRAQAEREVRRLKSKAERFPKRHQRLMGELLTARIDRVALLLANAGERKVELAQLVVHKRALAANRVGAIKTDSAMVVARCMRLTPGRSAECLDTEAGRAIEEADSQLDRRDVLRENYLRHQQDVARRERQLVRTKRGKTSDLRSWTRRSWLSGRLSVSRWKRGQSMRQRSSS